MKEFVTPTIEILNIWLEDVIATSGNQFNNDNMDDDGWG